MGTDITNEWEKRLSEEQMPKLKFPIKMLDDRLADVDLDFDDPIIKDPVDKKKPLNLEANVINVGKPRVNKNNKNKLF
jgi:hypothetical protein